MEGMKTNKKLKKTAKKFMIESSIKSSSGPVRLPTVTNRLKVL